MSGNRRKKTSPVLIFLYGAALAVVAADQFTKFLIVSHFAHGDSLPLVPGVFHLTLVFNTGIAFGMFNNNPQLLLAVITLSIAVLAYYAPRLAGSGFYTSAAMALILGGAVGNWIDRMRVHAVIDFLDFRIWPVFNLADTAISIGVGLLILKFITEKPAGADSDKPDEKRAS